MRPQDGAPADSAPRYANNGFVTSSGAIIVTTPYDYGSKNYRWDPILQDWSFTGLSMNWLGTSGIDQAHSGTIMAAEYEFQNVDHYLRVVKSTDDGASWETVMEMPGIGFSPRDVDHFHTCQVDPYTGNWYVSSGDHPDNHCRIWMSADDGNSWIEVTNYDPTPPLGLDPGRANLLHRHTDLWFTDMHIYWATDDKLDGLGSYLIRATKTIPIDLEPIGRVSYSDSRSAIDYGELGHLLITQNTNGYLGIELTLVTPSDDIVSIGTMEGTSGYFSGSHDGKDSVGDPMTGMTSFARARIPFPEDILYRGTWKYKIQRLLSVNVMAESENGIVSISNQPASSEGWRFGDVIQIDIHPNEGYHFVGVYSATDNEIIFVPSQAIAYPTSYNLTLLDDISVVALFESQTEFREGEDDGGLCPVGPHHTADQNRDYRVSLNELLRIVQFFNSGRFGCQADTEDGFAPNALNQECCHHDSDYNPAGPDWSINLTELLRLTQFFNSGGYSVCTSERTEDGFCPGAI
jgi:hypothetical protein